MTGQEELKYYRELYKELAKKYTKEELVEGFVFPADMTELEKEKADKELWSYRKKQLLKRKPEEKLYSGLLRMKYELEDYVESNEYDEEKTILYYLRDYLSIIKRKQKELAADIDVHPTRMNRILKGKERLSLSIAYRLEGHSGDIIPAILWWKLVQKEIEQEIRTDEAEKEKEKRRVKNIIYRRA